MYGSKIELQTRSICPILSTIYLYIYIYMQSERDDRLFETKYETSNNCFVFHIIDITIMEDPVRFTKRAIGEFFELSKNTRSTTETPTILPFLILSFWFLLPPNPLSFFLSFSLRHAHKRIPFSIISKAEFQKTLLQNLGQHQIFPTFVLIHPTDQSEQRWHLFNACK